MAGYSRARLACEMLIRHRPCCSGKLSYRPSPAHVVECCACIGILYYFSSGVTTPICSSRYSRRRGCRQNHWPTTSMPSGTFAEPLFWWTLMSFASWFWCLAQNTKYGRALLRGLFCHRLYRRFVPLVPPPATSLSSVETVVKLLTCIQRAYCESLARPCLAMPACPRLLSCFIHIVLRFTSHSILCNPDPNPNPNTTDRSCSDTGALLMAVAA